MTDLSLWRVLCGSLGGASFATAVTFSEMPKQILPVAAACLVAMSVIALADKRPILAVVYFAMIIPLAPVIAPFLPVWAAITVAIIAHLAACDLIIRLS